jgi:uncharacterized lipoprotein YehR (DUF1307 family)
MTLLAMAVLALVLLIACGDRQETQSPAPQVSGSDVKQEAQAQLGESGN